MTRGAKRRLQAFFLAVPHGGRSRFDPGRLRRPRRRGRWRSWGKRRRRGTGGTGGDGGAGGSGGSGGAGRTGGSEEFDPRPAQCKLERQGDECRACVAECCSVCEEGTDCWNWSVCTHECDEDWDGLQECDDLYPEGSTDWLGADICVVEGCSAVCSDES